MTSSDFSRFFAAINGDLPFPWQQRLVEEVAATGRWPETILIPTGCGKTAVVEACVFLLALDARMPRRVFFVVDRRLVVDQAYDRACRLAEQLRTSRDATVQQVAMRLLKFGSAVPLTVARLRGGLTPQERRWCEDPRQPTVITTTVDQVGSRLLFRGYGCSDSRRPIEAGLVGTHSQIIVDEAHMSQPFLDTLSAIQTHGATVSWCQMSATPRSSGAVFRMTNQDESHPALRQRLSAQKLTRLVETAKLSQTAVQHARELAAAEPVNVVGVVVNSVTDARRIFDLLRGKSDAVLLIGRIRPHDRDRLLGDWLPRLRTGRDRSADRPLVVVATQTIEVGADLDFDALVTEAAPIDVLRQRFGRLDRLGELGKTQAVIVRNPKRELPAYGEATRNAWQWLSARKEVDFGSSAMARELRDPVAPELLTPISNAPRLLPAHLQAWVMTRPSPLVDPAVAPFLHGPEALDADEVHIAWRGDLDAAEPDVWATVVGLAPPQNHELMPVPIGAARSWLRERPALVWRGEESFVESGDYGPGDTLVVPGAYGGSDAFGWAPDNALPVTDLGDVTGLWRRLHPGLLEASHVAELDSLLQHDEFQAQDFRPFLGGSPVPRSWTLYPDRSGIVLYFRAAGLEDDSANLAGRRVPLADHLRGVREIASNFATDIPERPQIEEAAASHDLGKLDWRFQTVLHGGRPAAASRALLAGTPLAKSGEAWNLNDYQRIRRQSGYPRFARHEASSTLLAAGEGASDLVLHLVAAHHGWARPGFLPWEDNEALGVRFEGKELSAPPGSVLAAVDSAIAERFDLLNQQLGAWRLAFLEGVLRLADQQRSAREAGGDV